MTRHIRTRVAVVGGGPVGLAAVHLLARWGIPAALLERDGAPSRHPRATIVNVRSMEILRMLGLSGRVRAAGVPAQSAARISWRTTMTGAEIGHLDIIESAQKLMLMAAQSPELPGICPQHRIVSILSAALAERDGIEVLLGHTATAVSARAEGVTVHAVGQDGPVTVEADYVLLAEGMHGRLRAQVGIEQTSAAPLGRLLDVHFRADLRPWTGRGGSAIYWVLGGDVRGALITVDPGAGEWLLEVPAMEAAQERALFDRESGHEAALVMAALGAGAAAVEVDVLSVRSWSMGTTTINRWRDATGRVFAVGDAAHTFPPTGGFGMNTGIQDAHNLVWKLGGVLHGWAEPALLDTYEAERRPVADFNAAQSEHNALQTKAFLADEARLRRMPPERLQSLIEAQRPHFDYPGQALGFCYRVGPDDDQAGVVAEVVWYEPSLRPGARAPHHWVDTARQMSTCDVSADGFAVLTEAGRTEPWSATDPTGVPLRVHGVAGLARLLAPDAAVLVRPDGHVAARLPGVDPARELTSAVRRSTAGAAREELLT